MPGILSVYKAYFPKLNLKIIPLPRKENLKEHFGKIYDEACLNEQDGLARGKYLKSGMGRRYLRNRLKRFLSLTGQVEEPKVPCITKVKRKS
jgi:hypothetical protein